MRRGCVGYPRAGEGVPLRFRHPDATVPGDVVGLRDAVSRRAQRRWILVTAMPEAFYLAGSRTANSRTAMVFAVALLLSLVLAAGWRRS